MSLVILAEPTGKTARFKSLPSSKITTLEVPAPISTKAVPNSFCAEVKIALVAAKGEAITFFSSISIPA